MSQTSNSGAVPDFDVEVTDGGVVYIIPVPIAEATLASSSQGSEYATPVLSSDPSRASEDSTPSLAEGPRELEKDERTGSWIDTMRGRCQSVHSDLTVRRRDHEDGAAFSRTILSELEAKAEGAGKIHTEGWCTLLDYETTKKDGYVQLSRDGANKFATLQEVLLWSKGEEKPAYSGKSDPNDVSHL